MGGVIDSGPFERVLTEYVMVAHYVLVGVLTPTNWSTSSTKGFTITDEVAEDILGYLVYVDGACYRWKSRGRQGAPRCTPGIDPHFAACNR